MKRTREPLGLYSRDRKLGGDTVPSMDPEKEERRVQRAREKEEKAAAAAAAKALKKQAALWKRQLKNLKQKNLEKKTEAIRFCVEDPLFIKHENVLPLLLSTLSKTKTADIIAEALDALEKIITPGKTDLTDLQNGNQSDRPESRAQHYDANALYIVSYCNQGDDEYEGGEVFLRLLTLSVSHDIKVRTVRVFEALLLACIRRANKQREVLPEMIALQTVASPSQALLSCLTTDNVELQENSLHCLQTLLLHPFVEQVLTDFEKADGIQRILKKLLPSNPNMKLSILEIVAYYSTSKSGRQLLRADAVSEYLKDFFLLVVSPAKSSITEHDDPNDPDGVAVEEKEMVEDQQLQLSKHLNLACWSFFRCEFASELESCYHQFSTPCVREVITAMINLIQKQLQVTDDKVKEEAIDSSRSNLEEAQELPVVERSMDVETTATLTSVLGRMLEKCECCKEHAKQEGYMDALLKLLLLKEECNSIVRNADKALHLCAYCVDPVQKANIIDPRVTGTIGFQSTDDNEDNKTDASKPFMIAENIVEALENAKSDDNKKLQFRLAHWLMLILQSPANAQALHKKTTVSLLCMLHDAGSCDEWMTTYLLASLRHLVVYTESINISGNENYGLVDKLLQILHEKKVGPSSASKLGNDQVSTSVTEHCEQAKDENEYYALEWADEQDLSSNFGYSPLTATRYELDVVPCIADLLKAITEGYVSSNTSKTPDKSALLNAVDYFRLRDRSSVPSSVKKDLMTEAQARIHGVELISSLVEHGLDLLELVPSFISAYAESTTAILEVVCCIIGIQGAVKTFLWYSESREKSDGAGENVNSEVHTDKWPRSADICANLPHYTFLKPIFTLMRDANSKYEQIDAATGILEIATSADVCGEEEYDKLINAIVATGGLVLLLSFLDTVRVQNSPTETDSRETFKKRLTSLTALLVTYGSKREDKSSETQTEKNEELGKKWAVEMLDARHTVSRFGYEGYTALLLAIELNQHQIVSTLIKANASANIFTLDGISPLMLALFLGEEEIVSELVTAGADLNALTSNDDEKPVWSFAIASCVRQNVDMMIDCAYRNSEPSGSISLPYLKMLDSVPGHFGLLQRCLEAGSEVGVSDNDGNFLLHSLLSEVTIRRKVRGVNLCVRYDSRNMDLAILVENLMNKHAADPHPSNKIGRTPLHYAVLYGHHGTAKYLLSCSTNPNVQDIHGFTPLHFACFGFASNFAEAKETILHIISKSTNFPIAQGQFMDENKHKSNTERQLQCFDSIMSKGLSRITTPVSIGENRMQSSNLSLEVSSFDFGVVPWHIACGVNFVISHQIFFDDVMLEQFKRNSSLRALILEFLLKKYQATFDFRLRLTKALTPLHLAIKSDEYGSNRPVIEVLLRNQNCREGQLNAVHEAMPIDHPPVIYRGTDVEVISNEGKPLIGFVTTRRMSGRYDIISNDGTLHTEVAQDCVYRVLSTLQTRNSGESRMYFIYSEHALAPLHYALQRSDLLSISLLSFPEVRMQPDGSDLPLLALACAARRSDKVISRLINSQANVRVALPLYGEEKQVKNSKQLAALHYAVLYEDVAMVRRLLSDSNLVNVNVRRSGDGFSPLHLACSLTNLELIQLLLDHGANFVQQSTNSETAPGTTPIQMLIQNDSNEWELITELIDREYLKAETLLEPVDGLELPADISMALDDDAREDDLTTRNIDTPVCVLLAEEMRNLALYNKLKIFDKLLWGMKQRHRKLQAELRASDRLLFLIYDLIKETEESSEAFMQLQHPHECYSKFYVRAHWEFFTQVSDKNKQDMSSRSIDALSTRGENVQRSDDILRRFHLHYAKYIDFNHQFPQQKLTKSGWSFSIMTEEYADDIHTRLPQVQDEARSTQFNEVTASEEFTETNVELELNESAEHNSSEIGQCYSPWGDQNSIMGVSFNLERIKNPQIHHYPQLYSPSTYVATPKDDLGVNRSERCSEMFVKQQQKHTNSCFRALDMLKQEASQASTRLLFHQIYSSLHDATYSTSEAGQERHEGLDYRTLLYQAEKELISVEKQNESINTQLRFDEEISFLLNNCLDELDGDLEDSVQLKKDILQRLEEVQVSIAQIEAEYSSLVYAEAKLEAEAEALPYEIERNEQRLSELYAKTAYLELTSRAPLKKQMKIQKYNEKVAALALEAKRVEDENEILHQQLQNYEVELSNLDKQIQKDLRTKSQCEQDLQIAENERDEAEKQLREAQGCHTPRPDWARIIEESPELSSHQHAFNLLSKECLTVSEALLKADNGKRTSSQLVLEMLHWLDRIQKRCGVNFRLSKIWHDTEEARVELNNLHIQYDRVERKFTDKLAEYGIIPKGSGNSPNQKEKYNYIVALGARESIPRYLRHQGKIRRKQITKTVVEEIVRSVWSVKRKREWRNPHRRLPLEDILYEYLYRKYGFQPLIAEWGYNLVFALEAYSWDAEIELFFLCLSGAISDLVYVDQETMLNVCKSLFGKLCDSYANNTFGTVRRMLLKDAFTTLRSFFPLKTSIQLQAIEKAIIQDMHKVQRGGTDSLLYLDDVFPPDTIYPRGYFVKTLRSQHYKEIQDYYMLLLSELTQRDKERSGKLSLNEIKEAMLTVDPLTNIAAVLSSLMKGLGINSKTKLVLANEVDYKDTVKKMCQNGLLKFTMNYDDEAKASRILLPQAS